MTLFYILIILTGAGHGESIAVDHFGSLAFCEAAGKAVTESTKDKMTYKVDYICVEAKQ